MDGQGIATGRLVWGLLGATEWLVLEMDVLETSKGRCPDFPGALSDSEHFAVVTPLNLSATCLSLPPVESRMHDQAVLCIPGC